MSHLITRRRFYPLLITQFLGAFNDNLFKNALLTLVALKMADQAHILANVIAGVFILPFFLFSATAGEIADKLPRHQIARFLKLIEIILMLGVAVAYASGSLPLLVVIMALMGMQSAFFGPVKYALLPQQLKPEELITGNAYVEASTYLAILFGLIFGALLPIHISIGILIMLAICGYLASCRILPAPAPRPHLIVRRNLGKAIYANYRFLKRQTAIFQSVMGATWFWIIGALIAVQIYPLCGQILNADETVIAFFLVLFSLGVAFGSFACSRLLKGEISTVYVPASAVGMSLSLFFLWFLSTDYPKAETTMNLTHFLQAPHALGLSVNLFVLAFWGGLYIVPLNAFMQNRAPKAYTASIIAGNNIFNALGMTFAAVFAVVLFKFGLTLPQLFLVMSLISLGVALYICALLPDALTRSFLQTLLRLMFRTHIHGLQNFKKAGSKTVIVANHISLLDGILLAAFMPERITFAINTEWTEKWFMPIIRAAADFYPVDANNPLSVRRLIEEVKKGRKVVIFPEGRISLTGKIMQVFDGAAMVAARAGAKLLPVRIDGAEYSKLSYIKDNVNSRWFPQINLHILPARPFDLPASKDTRRQTAQKFYCLMTEMYFQTTSPSQNLYEALLNAAKKHGYGKRIGIDLKGKALTYRNFLSQVYTLAENLREKVEDNDVVALDISDGQAFLKAVFALQYLGKSILILEPENAAQQLKQSGVQICLTEHQAADETSEIFVNIKELKKKYWWRRAPSLATENLRISGFKNDQIVSVSASEILTNLRRLNAVLPLNSIDTAVNIVQPYQVEGLALAYLLPLFSGVKTCFLKPRYAKFMPRICYELSASILFSHETFLDAAESEASAFDFFKLQMAFSIGRKMDNSKLERWLKVLNVRLLESYIPVDGLLIEALNTPIYNRLGTYGSPLPGLKLPTDEDGFVIAG